MNRFPLLFRCDGTPQHGWHPLYQCLTLAAALQRRRRGTHFLSRLEPLNLAQTITRGNNEWHPAEAPLGTDDDLRQTIAEIRKLQAAAVIVAGHDVTSDYLAELSATGALVMTVDSQAAIRFPNKLIVNPMLGPGRESYEYRRGAQMLLGPRYALVRSMIRRMRPIRSTEPPQPYRAMVALGDDDLAGETVTRTRQLLETSRIERVDVVVRPHHPHLPALKDLAEQAGNRMAVLTEQGEVSKSLGRSHFALTSGDSWSLELACLGLPQLMILPPGGANRVNAQRLDEEGAATLLGTTEEATPLVLRTAVQTVLTDPMERLGMARCGRQLIDGRGPDRIVNALEVMLHPAAVAGGQKLAA
jgi:spore coat polysaccharide biosynthesis predicted glycosyltransferase SpsG